MKAVERLDALPGLIPHEQGLVMAEFANQVSPDQAIVEIGSFKGKSTCYLAFGAGAIGAHVYAIDPWDLPTNIDGKHGFAQPEVREAFDAAVRSLRYGKRITPIQAHSVDVAHTWEGPPVGLLYIDGDHRYPFTWQDFFYWQPHLAPGAVILYDDYETPRNPGVKQATDEIRAKYGYGFSVDGRLAILRT